MKTQTGKQLLFKFGGKSIFHAQTHEFTSTANFEEWETKDTDGVQNELTSITGTASANGIVNIREAADATADAFDSPELFDEHLKGTKGTLLLQLGNATYQGDAWITDFNGSGENSKLATFSASFKFNKLKKVEATTTEE